MKKAMVVLVMAATFLGVSDGLAAPVTTGGSGNWSSTVNNAPWPGGTVPAAGDDIIIDSSHSVTVSSSVANSPASITINAGGLFDVNSALTVNGPVTVSADGLMDVGAGTFTVNGATTVSGTLLHSNTTGAKTYNGDVTIFSGGIWTNSVAEGMIYGGNITIHAGGSMIENGAGTMSFAGSFRNDGSYESSTGDHTFSGIGKTFGGTIVIPKVIVTGTYTNSGTLTVSTAFTGTGGSLTQGQNAILNIGGTLTVTTLDASASGNTVSYTNAGTQTVKPSTYHNLILSGTSAKTMTSVTVNGILSMEGTATASVAPTYGANAALQYNTAASRTAGVEWITPFAASGGLVITNTGVITLNAAKVLNTSVPLVIHSGATLNTGNLNLTLGGVVANSGTFTVGTSTVEWNGDSQYIAAAAYKNLILSGSGVKAIGSDTSVSGVLSIGPSGSVNVSIGTGLDIPVNILTIGGFGQAGGTWGSSSSTAANKNDTVFELTTGYLTVARALAYHVVPVNPLAESPFDTWAKATTNIQVAVNKASADLALADGAQCTVLVSNGIYTVTSEITITNGIALRSVSTNWNDTTIRGGYPASTNRCLNITGDGAVVEGFTITNGRLGASVYGAGINMTGAATVRNCLVIGNSISGNSAYGGGIFASKGLVANCTIQNNTVSPYGGGGISLDGVAAVVSNCLVTGNQGNGDGGGIRLSRGTVVNSIISRNTATTGNGGGILQMNNTGPTVRGCLIVANQARGTGGGVQVDTASTALFQIQNCTISGNTASNAGGVFIATNHHLIVNSIIAQNQATNSAGKSNIASLDAVNADYSCSPDLVVGSSSNITADPRFVTNGIGYGPAMIVGDYRLKAGSPCIDTGTNQLWMVASAVDILGDLRVQGAGPNMGAYETPVSALSGTVFSVR